MIPKTSVSPAARRKSSSPNCRPFRHCSRKRSMGFGWQRSDDGAQKNGGQSLSCPPSFVLCRLTSPLHRALVVELVLAVLDDGRDSLERQVAVRVLHHVLEIEILDREVVVAVF